jgi:uncharacterized membrane protein
MKRFGTSTTLTLAGIVLVAVILRVYHIGYESLWTDEIATLQQSCARPAGRFPLPQDVIHRPGVDTTRIAEARDWRDIFPTMQADTHPPLYPLTLRVWRTMFGDGDVAARSLSAACSLVSILLLFDICRLLHGRSAGFWAAAIMAVATPQIVFAHEARSYTMVVMLVLASIDTLVRIEKLGSTTRRTLGLGVLTFAAVHTHYLTFSVIAAMGLYALLRLHGSARRSTITALAAAILVFAIDWGPTLLRQRPNFTTHLAWISDDAPGLAGRTLTRLATLPVRFLITPRDADSGGAAAMLGAICFLAPLLLIRRKDPLIWILLGAAVIGSAAFADLLAHRRTLTELRFTLAAAPALYALIAAASASLPRRWLTNLVPALVVASCVAALPEAYNRYWKPDYRGFAVDFDRVAGPDDLIVCVYRSPDDWYESILLAATTHYSAHPNRPMLILSGPITSALHSEVVQAPAVWFISGDPSFAADRFIPGARIELMGGVPQVGVFLKVR